MKELIKSGLKKLISEQTVPTTEKIDTSLIRIKKNLVNNLLVFQPYYKNKPMGAFRLTPYNEDYRIYGVVLYDRFKGQGIGKGMYKYIIGSLRKEGKKLYSDNHQSQEAQNVWDSLVNDGVAIKIDGGYMSK